MVELKQDEFLNLKQGSMSMCEYRDRFTQLLRYTLGEMEEKKRKCDLQRQLRNTRLCFAIQPEYQSHPMNLPRSMDQDQYQQSNDEVQHFSSQEPCVSPPTITLM